MVFQVLGFIALPTMIAWAIVRPHRRSTTVRVLFALGVAAFAFYAADWLASHPV